MSKRKISERQTKNVQNQQSKRGSTTTEALTGLVLCHYGVQAIVQLQAHPHTIFQCHKRTHIDIAAGDEVIFEPQHQTEIQEHPTEIQSHQTGTQSHQTGVIVATKPRKNALSRKTNYRHEAKILAANVDQAFIVFAPEPMPTPLFIDQLLVGLGMLNIDTFLILNKADLITKDIQFSDALTQKEKYCSIGYTVFTTGNHEHDDLEKIKSMMQNKNNILVGQSGVGKSSLLNRLIPQAQAKTSELTQESRLGKHTTIHSMLYPLPSGGCMIDSPGVRQWQHENLEKENLVQYFPEIDKWQHECKFRNCSHQKEPQCKVKEKAEEGVIHPERWKNFCTLQQLAIENKGY